MMNLIRNRLIFNDIALRSRAQSCCSFHHLKTRPRPNSNEKDARQAKKRSPSPIVPHFQSSSCKYLNSNSQNSLVFDDFQVSYRNKNGPDAKINRPVERSDVFLNPSTFSFNYRLYFLLHNSSKNKINLKNDENFGDFRRNLDNFHQKSNEFHRNFNNFHQNSLNFANFPKFFHSSSHFSAPQKTLEEKEARKRVHQTLQILKEELQMSTKEDERLEQAQKFELEKKKLTWTEWLKDGLMHYYHGFKLFFIEVRVSTRLLREMLKGRSLTRQEKLQLARSAADLFRLVPFLVFIIVPFMEFLLPFYLKLFPGALPSTFQERSKEEEKLRQNLKLKLEMAKFLQETVSELATERKTKGTVDSKITDFSSFLKNIREGGGYVSNTQLLNYSKLFEDELTLDNLSEAQLRALCRIVGITPIGVANILRFQLSMKLNELKADDRLIYKEGVENLSVQELQAANRARGMRSVGVPEERLRQQLNQWLELSFNEKVPPSLLLLSSTLYLPEEVTFSHRLKTIMSTLPAHLADEVKTKIAETEGGSSLDNKSKFELLHSIEDILKREKEARRKQRQLAEEKARLEEKAKQEQQFKEVEQANLELQAKLIAEQDKAAAGLKHEADMAEDAKILAAQEAIRLEQEKQTLENPISVIDNGNLEKGPGNSSKNDKKSPKNGENPPKNDEKARKIDETARKTDETALKVDEAARKNEELAPKPTEKLVGLKNEELLDVAEKIPKEKRS